jgi:hypothetical protein
MIASIQEEIAGALTTAEKEWLYTVLAEQCARDLGGGPVRRCAAPG